MDELAIFGNSMFTAFEKLGTINKGLVSSTIVYASYKILISMTHALMKVTILRGSYADDPSKSKYDPKKIYLHIYPRSMTYDVPNMSPFVIKLETWLRMMKIEYKIVETMKMSRATRQMPYIFHKGKEITDTDLIIEYLQKEYELDNTEGLDPSEKAISRSFMRMADESIFGTVVTSAICLDPNRLNEGLNIPVPKLFMNYITSYIANDILKRMKARGIGRKSRDEIFRIGCKDIKALSSYLGKNKFLLGGHMTQVDCSIFGQLTEVMFLAYHHPFRNFINEDCQNIVAYMDGIKEKCWPDWEDLVTRK